MWETKPRTNPQKTSGLLIGPEQVTRSKPSKLYDDDGDDDNDYDDDELQECTPCQERSC